MIGIYKITNKKNGKVYIGQSVDIKKRWKQHITDLNKEIHCNYLLQDDWNIYGQEYFEFKILKKCSSKELDPFEKWFIKKYNSYNNGYNLKDGNGNKCYIRENNYVNENLFYMNENNKIQYNDKCKYCKHECKQSFRSEILLCRNC